MMNSLLALLLLCVVKFDLALSAAFVTQKSHLQHHTSNKKAGRHLSSLSATKRKKIDKEDKFSFQQRIESVKTAAVGALSVCLFAKFSSCAKNNDVSSLRIL
jgi:hypothetical protein